MLSNKILALTLITLTLLMMGCDTVVTIEEPLADDTVYHESNLPNFNVTWTENSTDVFTARLNGKDITDFFTVNDSSAQLQTPLPSSAFRNGSNTFQASKGNEAPDFFSSFNTGAVLRSSKFVRFSYDTLGPNIHITSLDDLSSDSYLKVYGYLDDISGIESMTWSDDHVSNQAVSLTAPNEDGHRTFVFQMIDHPSNSITLTATDVLGHSNDQVFFRNYFGPKKDNLRKGMEVRLGHAFFDSAESLIKTAIEPLLNIDETELAQNYLLNGLVGGRIGFKKVELALEDLNLDIAENTDLHLDIDADLSAELDLEICGKLLIEICVTLSPSFGQILAGLSVAIEVSDENEIGIKDIDNLEYEVNDIDVRAFDRIPLLNNIVDETVSRVVSIFGRFLKLVFDLEFDNQIKNILNDFLRGMPIEFSPSLNFQNGQPNRAICMGGFFDEFINDGDYLLVQMGMELEVRDFPQETPFGIRTYEFNPAEDLFGPDGKEYDAVISISANTINQLLDGIFRAGLFHLDLDNIVVIAGKTYSVKTRPSAAPFVSMNQFDLAMTEFHLWDFNVSIESLIDENNPELGWEEVAQTVMQIDVPLNFFLTNENTNIMSAFTQEVNVNMTQVQQTTSESLSALSLSRLAYSLSGPLLTISSDAMSEFQQPTLPSARPEQGTEDFWLDAENGAFKIGIILANNSGLDEGDPSISLGTSFTETGSSQKLFGCDKSDW